MPLKYYCTNILSSWRVSPSWEITLPHHHTNDSPPANGRQSSPLQQHPYPTNPTEKIYTQSYISIEWTWNGLKNGQIVGINTFSHILSLKLISFDEFPSTFTHQTSFTSVTHPHGARQSAPQYRTAENKDGHLYPKRAPPNFPLPIFHLIHRFSSLFLHSVT